MFLGGIERYQWYRIDHIFFSKTFPNAEKTSKNNNKMVASNIDVDISVATKK